MERCRAGLHFDNVTRVASTGFDRSNREGVLNLLSIAFHEGEAPAGTIELVFSGGAAIRLDLYARQNRIEGNELAGNGTDLVYGPTGTSDAGGNCFTGNTFTSSAPASIEQVMGCGGASTLQAVTPFVSPPAPESDAEAGPRGSSSLSARDAACPRILVITVGR